MSGLSYSKLRKTYPMWDVAADLLPYYAPDGELFLPSIIKCNHCLGKGIYKVWGLYDIKCYLCGGTGEYK